MLLDLNDIEDKINAAQHLSTEQRAARAMEINDLIGSHSQHTVLETQVPWLQRLRRRMFVDLLDMPVAKSGEVADAMKPLATEKDEEPRFWAMDIDKGEPSEPTNWLDDGVLVGIVDEQEGGIIVYCHRDNEDRILNALRAAG